MAHLTFPKVIGHRGACAYAPENTLASFKKAYDLGVKWIECDVKLTADNELIIFHDDRVDRTTDGSGFVKDFTVNEIKKLDAGSWFSKEFVREKIPTLKQLIDFLNRYPMGVNIEIKACPGREKETAQATIEYMKEYWPSSIPLPLFSSFSMESLKQLREIAHDATIGLLCDQIPSDWEEQLKLIDAVSLHVGQQYCDAAIIESIKSKGYFALAYTVNENERAHELFIMGVDALFSDCPDQMNFL